MGAEPDVEAAIADARECWEKCRPYTKPSGAKTVRAAELIPRLQEATWDPRDIQTQVLLGAAYKGDVVADDLLRAFAYHLSTQGAPLPVPLAYYLCHGKPPKGGKRSKEKKTQYRDISLAAIVHRIVGRGFQAYRNKATRQKSKGHDACAIVAEATCHGNSVVEEAWRKFGKWSEIADMPLSQELSPE